MGPRRGHRARRVVRLAAGAAVGRARRSQSSDPAHTRQVRPPHRRGRVRPGLPRADARRRRPRPARGAVGRRPARLACRPRREDVGVDARARPYLPHLDDVRGDPGAALQPRVGRNLRAAAREPRIRPRAQSPGHQGRDHRGHVDDREAGRLRRARRDYAGHPQRRRQLQPHRAQVVHLRADVRRVSRARPGSRRLVVLLPAARTARRHPQPDVPAAAQGQARQPRQRVQ